MDKIITISGVAVLIVLLSFALHIGVNRAERVECEEWHRQAEQFEGYYSTSWQLAQCQHHGLPLPR